MSNLPGQCAETSALSSVLSATECSPQKAASASEQSPGPVKPVQTPEKIDERLPGAPQLFADGSMDDTRAAQDALAAATRDFSYVLGAGHVEVEIAKKQIQKLRAWDENLRWREVVQWHEHNIAAALVAVEDGSSDIERLEQAVKRAHDSELGPGHALVLVGKDCITQLRKRAAVTWLQDNEERHANMLQQVMDTGDQDELLKAIKVCAEAIGASHPVVEAARLVHKQRRSIAQKNDWEELVIQHGDLLRSACATRSRPMMEGAIELAINAGLGIGHPLVLEAKRDLTIMRKQEQRDRFRKEQATCEHRLRSLASQAERSLMLRQQQVEDARAATLQLLPGSYN